MNEPQRVMVIDDDDGLREILGLALRAEGYEVESAKDGAEGLGLLASRRADLVIVDLRMPEVDGGTFCRLYAQQGAGGGPVMLMTAMPGRAAVTDLPGVIEVVAKPFDLERLLGVVARVLSRSR
jgi:two-component system response regulator MprA